MLPVSSYLNYFFKNDSLKIVQLQPEQNQTPETDTKKGLGSATPAAVKWYVQVYIEKI